VCAATSYMLRLWEADQGQMSLCRKIGSVREEDERGKQSNKCTITRLRSILFRRAKKTPFSRTIISNAKDKIKVKSGGIFIAGMEIDAEDGIDKFHTGAVALVPSLPRVHRE